MLREFSHERVGYLAWLIPLGFVLRRQRRQTLSFLVVIVIMSAVVIWNNGDWMPHSRLLAPLLPFALVAAVMPIARIRSSLGVYPTMAAQLFAAALMTTYGMHLLFYERDVKPERNRVADHMLTLGRSLGAAQQGAGLLATDMAGRVPYASHLRTLDMFGLCDLHIARYGKPVMHMGKIDNPYVYAKRPDFYFFNITRTVRGIVHSPEFSAYSNDYWILATPFDQATNFVHGKLLLARKDLPNLESLRVQLKARLIDPKTL